MWNPQGIPVKFGTYFKNKLFSAALILGLSVQWCLDIEETKCLFMSIIVVLGLLQVASVSIVHLYIFYILFLFLKIYFWNMLDASCKNR